MLKMTWFRKITILILVFGFLGLMIRTELRLTLSELDNRSLKTQIDNAYLNNYTWSEAVNRAFFQVYDREVFIIKVLGGIAQQITKPDFNILMRGTVIVYNHEKASLGSGVCIKEDTNYYYILSANHVVNKSYTLEQNYLPLESKEDYKFVPETNMGESVKLQYITEFVKDIPEVTPKLMTFITVMGYESSTEYAGEVIKLSEDYDLSILRVSKNNSLILNVLPIATTSPLIGDVVWAVGHSLGTRFNVSQGIVSNLYDPIFMITDAMTTYGNSGGGIFNNRGELIGIVSRVCGYVIDEEIEKEK